MNTRPISLALFLLVMPASATTFAAEDMNELKAAAVRIVKQFGGSLKPELKRALQSGGPAHAISVCSDRAPAIARQLRNDSGWYLKRVSLKPRNVKTATPDAWERKVLQQFEQRQANGESADRLAHAEIVEGRFRFMKAQVVEGVCLGCHGTDLKPATEAALEQKYPQDEARGYSLGQIRGAFSLARDL